MISINEGSLRVSGVEMSYTDNKNKKRKKVLRVPRVLYVASKAHFAVVVDN